MGEAWRDYEKFTESLIRTFQDQGRAIRELGRGHGNRIEGMSGVRHQVDVSFIDESAFPLPILYLIECKYVSSAVEIDFARNAWAVHEDVRHKRQGTGVQVETYIVSTVAASPDASRYAKFKGVRLVLIPKEGGFSWVLDNFGMAVLPLFVKA